MKSDHKTYLTTARDMRAGWRRFRGWARRFRATPLLDDSPDNKIYLSSWQDSFNLDEMGDYSDDASTAKVGFMHAYLTVYAADSETFEADVIRLTGAQNRSQAPRSHGFWFDQSDMVRFGHGVCPWYQESNATFFCTDLRDIDFSIVSAVQPFDRIAYRSPGGAKITASHAAKILKRIETDFASSGLDGTATAHIAFDIIQIEMRSPDFGGHLNSNTIRCYRRAEVYRSVVSQQVHDRFASIFFRRR